MTYQPIIIENSLDSDLGDDPRNTKWLKINANFAELYGGAVESYGAKGDGITDDTAAFNAAATAANAAGGGFVQLKAITYYVAGNVPLQANVIFRGSGFVANSNTATFTPTAGTILKGSGANIIFGYNTTDGVSQPTQTQAANAQLKCAGAMNMSFINCGYAIKVGSLFNSGTFNGLFQNLYASTTSTWGFYFENCSGGLFQNLYTIGGSIGSGGIYMGASQTAYNNGNFPAIGFYVSGNGQLSRNLVFQARAGAALNNVSAVGVAAGGTAPGQVSAAVTFPGGTATISLPGGQGVNYPLDMPVIFSSTTTPTSGAAIGGFTKLQTYFVGKNGVARGLSAGQVQGGNTQCGAAVVSTAASGYVIQYGFPGVEICGYSYQNDPNNIGTITSQIQGSIFSNLDVEGSGTTQTLVQNASAMIDMGFSDGGAQGTNYASTLCLRQATSTQGMIGSWRIASIGILDSDGCYSSFPCLGATLSGTNGIINQAPYGFYGVNGAYYNALALGQASNGFGSNNYGPLSVKITYPSTTSPQLNFCSPVTEATASFDSGFTFSIYHPTCIAFTGAGPATFTLPALDNTAFASASGSLCGLKYEVCNAGSGTLTLSTQSSQLFNKVAAKTSYSLTAGQSISVRAQFDGTNSFWQVIGNNGAT